MVTQLTFVMRWGEKRSPASKIKPRELRRGKSLVDFDDRKFAGISDSKGKKNKAHSPAREAREKEKGGPVVRLPLNPALQENKGRNGKGRR